LADSAIRNSKTRMEYVKELAAARQEKAELEQQLKKPSLAQEERAALSNKIAVLRSDNIAKLVALIQGIDFTYHAPTLEELRRKGVKPGESLTVTITATRVDDSGTHKTETQLKVVGAIGANRAARSTERAAQRSRSFDVT